MGPLEAALAYAARGWRVIPVHGLGLDGCCTCFAGPRCTQPGKHPVWKGWQEQATTDEAVLRLSWNEQPSYNVGIATGAGSGVLVLDVDVKANGQDNLRDHLARVGGDMPRTVVALTGGGGWHYFFKHVAGVGNRAGMLPGVDVRGDGGQVVAAPSRHASGKVYRWATGRGPGEAEIVEAPKWLLDMLRGPAAPAQGQPGTYWRGLFEKGAGEGGRNDSVARIAGHLLRRRVDPYLVLEVCRMWNAAKCRPPLSADEVYTTVNSIAGKEMDRINKRRARGA